jgi:hypothetical protein
MSSHGGAVAVASPYLGSIIPVVMLQSTRPGPATHRPAAPICLARARGSDGVTSQMLAGSLGIVRHGNAWREDPDSMRAGPGAVLPLTLLGEGGKRGSQPFDLAVCIESHKFHV